MIVNEEFFKDFNKLVIGKRELERQIFAGNVKFVLLADDVDNPFRNKITLLCRENGIEAFGGITKNELGQKLNLSVACGVCGLKK